MGLAFDTKDTPIDTPGGGIMNEGIGGPTPEDMNIDADAEKSVEKEPTVDEYLAAIEDWKEELDKETFLSLQEEFKRDIDGGIGYLSTVAAEHGLNAEELLRKYNLTE